MDCVLFDPFADQLESNWNMQKFVKVRIKNDEFCN